MDKDFPEAPASATISIEIDGFNTLFTIRERSVKDLYIKTKTMIEQFKHDGVKPQVKTNGFTKKPEVPYDENSPAACKAHKVMMKERTGQDGSSYYSHSRGTYPNLDYCNGKGFKGEQTPVSRTDWPEVAPF